MEGIEDRVEGFVKKVIADFEAKPIATTLKGVVIIYVLKVMVKWFKG